MARLSGLALLAGAAIAARPAHADAVPVCVASEAELASALISAEFVPTKIEIVQGNYDIRNTILHAGALNNRPLQQGSELLGGYMAGCAGRNIAVGNTVLTDSNPRDDGADPLGDFTMEGLTWTSRVSFFAGAEEHSLPAGTTVLIRRNAFLNANGGGLDVLWFDDDDDPDGTIRIVDTLIAGNSGDGCTLNLEAVYGSPAVQLVNNTVVDNSGAGTYGAGLCVFNASSNSGGDGHATLDATNNIFWGNSGNNINTTGVPVVALFVDNVIGPHDTPGALELGTLDVNPRLDSNYRPIESPPSPVINSGSNTAPGGLPPTDLPGRNRIVGGIPDRGAFESTIDDAYHQTVSTNSDTGVGSLRAAIASVNAHGSGLITFDLGSGCGPHVITLNSPLPTITAPIIINGYSQAGSTPNDLDIGDDATFCVIIESGDASVTRGLVVPASAGDGVSLFVEGLAFSNFSDTAVDLASGSGHIVVGNRFGGSASGRDLLPNGIGVQLDAAAHDSTVGGDDDSERNILSGATGSGLAIFQGSHDNQIAGNLIGVGWSGDASGHFTDVGNGTRGIYLAGHDNEISGNWIGDNAQAGIAVANGGATGNTIEDNYIGFAWGVSGPYGNGQAGVHFEGSANDAPEMNKVLDNTLEYNATQGVWVEIGQGNKIRRNSIQENGGLGIDLVDPGVLPNDNDAAAQPTDYANRGLNYPELSAAGGGYDSGTFTGLLESTLGTYRIDFYQTTYGCDPNDNRQGEYWIGSTLITISTGVIGGDGVAGFSVILGPGNYPMLPSGSGITATATDSSGNTSEFSACVPYVNDTIFANGFEPQA